MNIKKFKNSVFDFVIKRKIISIILAIVIILIGYWSYRKLFPAPVINNYVLGNAKIANIVTTITGTGQVTASNQLDIKSKVSGDLVYLNTKANGTQIKKGTLIAQVDARDALVALESARIAYAKLTKPATESEILKAQSTLNDAIATNKKSYEDAFSTIASTFIDLPTVLSGLNDMLYTSSGYLDTENVRSVGQNTGLSYRDKTTASYDKAKGQYDAMSIRYKNLSRTSDTSTIENFLNDTYYLTKDVSEALKNAQNTVDFLRKQKSDSAGTTASGYLSTWTSTINTDLNTLLTIKTTMLSSANDIKESTLDLNDLKDGPDSLDIRSEKLSLQQKENAYADYFIRAPFDGVLARLTVKGTDTVSNGTVIGTIVSPQKIATITLNEVDIEKVKVGQVAELTFDAVNNLTIPGTVTTVDLVGTVTQGVVNYNVEISLEGDDARVKPGMSVSASIITDTKNNVLTVPSSAVKSQGKNSYVEVFDPAIEIVRGSIGTPSKTLPTRKSVETGISNDSLIEIISGINEGDQIVIRTVKSADIAKASATPQKSLFGTGGRAVGGGQNK